MSEDFKESACKGNQSKAASRERDAVVQKGRNLCALWDRNTEVVLQTIAGLLIIFRKVVGKN